MTLQEQLQAKFEFPLTIFSMWAVYHMLWYWIFRTIFRRIPQFKKRLQDLNIPYERYVRFAFSSRALNRTPFNHKRGRVVWPLRLHRTRDWCLDSSAVVASRSFGEGYCAYAHSGVLSVRYICGGDAY